MYFSTLRFWVPYTFFGGPLHFFGGPLHFFWGPLHFLGVHPAPPAGGIHTIGQCLQAEARCPVGRGKKIRQYHAIGLFSYIFM